MNAHQQKETMCRPKRSPQRWILDEFARNPAAEVSTSHIGIAVYGHTPCKRERVAILRAMKAAARINPALWWGPPDSGTEYRIKARKILTPAEEQEHASIREAIGYTREIEARYAAQYAERRRLGAAKRKATLALRKSWAGRIIPIFGDHERQQAATLDRMQVMQAASEIKRHSRSAFVSGLTWCDQAQPPCVAAEGGWLIAQCDPCRP